MKKSKMIGVIISAIVIIVSVFAVVYNAVIVYNSDLKYISYKNIEGTVSSVQAASYSDGKSYYNATYTFTINGSIYNCNSSLTEDFDEYKTGDVATVRYDTKNPNNCFIDSGDSIWSYLYLGISCVILIIAIKVFDKLFRGYYSASN